MPIYEFYCKECNVIFNFFSKTINTTKLPMCPKCKIKKLSRQMSVFSIAGSAEENDTLDDMPLDEGKMEEAMQMLAKNADKIDEDDPRQAADLMRKLTHMTGLELGDNMKEALSRMEQGEDPEAIESEMGDLLESEDPFIITGRKNRAGQFRNAPPKRDDTLYDL